MVQLSLALQWSCRKGLPSAGMAESCNIALPYCTQMVLLTLKIVMQALGYPPTANNSLRTIYMETSPVQRRGLYRRGGQALLGLSHTKKCMLMAMLRRMCHSMEMHFLQQPMQLQPLLNCWMLVTTVYRRNKNITSRYAALVQTYVLWHYKFMFSVSPFLLWLRVMCIIGGFFICLLWWWVSLWRIKAVKDRVPCTGSIFSPSEKEQMIPIFSATTILVTDKYVGNANSGSINAINVNEI